MIVVWLVGQVRRRLARLIATAPGSGLILVIDDAGAIQTAMQSLLVVCLGIS